MLVVGLSGCSGGKMEDFRSFCDFLEPKPDGLEGGSGGPGDTVNTKGVSSGNISTLTTVPV